MYGFKRILVPSDFSESSLKALGLAMSLAVRFDSHLFLLHVEPGSSSGKAWMTNEAAKAKIDALEEDERRLFDQYQAASVIVESETDLPPIPRAQLHFRVSGGDVGASILTAAEDAQIDLVVMATQGRNSVKDFFVGSTTERVIQKATCSVLAVKPDGYPFLRE